MSERSSVDNAESCEAVQDLLPLYALNLLDIDEQLIVERHLPICPRCAAELTHFEATGGALGFGLEPVEPTPGLRVSLLDRVAALPQDRVDTMPAAQEAAASPSVAPVATLASTTEPAAPANVTSIASRRSPAWKTWFAATAAALVLTIGGGAYWTNTLIDDRDDARETVAMLSQFVQPDNTTIAMNTVSTGTCQQDVARGNVMQNASGEMVVAVTHCPPSASNLTYKVWVAKGEDVVMLGDMVVDANGSGWMPLAMPTEMPTPDILGVTAFDGTEKIEDIFIGEMSG